MASSQIISKGKEVITEASGRKTRKNAGTGKGKSKVISMGHRVAQPETLLKRTSGEKEESQKAVRKLKKNSTETQSTRIYGELRGMEAVIM